MTNRDGQDQCEFFDVMPSPKEVGMQSHGDWMLERNQNGRFPVVTRRQAHLAGHWHRSIGVWLYTADGKVVIQKRSMLKDTQPGKWTMSAAGHVTSGDSVTETVLNEIREELGLMSIKQEELELLGIFTESDVGSTDRFGAYIDNEYKCLFIARIEEQELTVNQAEVSEAIFVDVHEVFSKLREKDESFCVVPKEDLEIAYSAIVSRLELN